MTCRHHHIRVCTIRTFSSGIHLFLLRRIGFRCLSKRQLKYGRYTVMAVHGALLQQIFQSMGQPLELVFFSKRFCAKGDNKEISIHIFNTFPTLIRS